MRALIAALVVAPCVAAADVAVWVKSNLGQGASSIEPLDGGSVLFPDKRSNKVIALRQTPPYEGIVLREWGARGADSARVTPAGTLLISETDGNRVIELGAPDGGIVWAFGSGSQDCDAGNLYYPADAIRLASGETLITDAIHNRLLRVARDGGVAWAWGDFDGCQNGSSDAELDQPFGLDALDGGELLIADYNNDRVLWIAPQGTRGGTIRWRYGDGTPGAGANQVSSPVHAALLPNGHVLISDGHNHRVIEVVPQGSAGGEIVWQFGTGAAGSDGVQLNQPYHAVRLSNGHTLIADRGNNRLLEVAPLSLAFARVPELNAGACSGPATLELRDADGMLTGAVFASDIALTSDSSTTHLFSDECVTEASTLSLAGGATSVSFWFRDDRAASQTLTASAAGVVSATVHVGPPEPPDGGAPAAKNVKGWGCAATPGLLAWCAALWLLRSRRRWLFVLATVLAPALATASEDTLMQADVAYARNDFAAARKGYEQAIVEGQLRLKQMQQAYEGIALSSAVLLDRERAAWAFIRLLVLDPQWQLPRDAGPKIRGPFDEAKAFWFGKTLPRITVEHPRHVVPGAAFMISLRVPQDAIGLVRSVRVEWQKGARQLAAGSDMAMIIPVEQLPDDGLVLSVQGFDEHGSEVIVLPEERIKLRESAPVVASSGPIEGRHWLHVRAAGFAQILARAWGLEAGLAIGLTDFLEAGAAVTIGEHPGGQVFFGLHTPGGRVRPYAQVRVDIVPLPEGPAFGGGLLAGVQLAVGPGHLFAGVLGELFRTPDGYRPYGVSAIAGYELEVLSAR